MRIFTKQEATFEHVTYFSDIDKLSASTTIVPVLNASDQGNDEAREELVEVQEHFRKWESAACYLDLSFSSRHDYLHTWQEIIVTGPFLDEMVKLYGNGILVKVKIEGLRWPLNRSSNRHISIHFRRNLCLSYTYDKLFNWETNDMRVDFEGDGSNMFYCRDTMCRPPSNWSRQFAEASRNLADCSFEMRVKVEFSLTNPGSVSDLKLSHALSVNHKILTEELLTDVTLVAPCGAEIKCHRSFLSAHSSVFATMFESGFKESRTSIVKMVNMTKEGVKAFLEYIYYWEISHARNNPRIAFELFEAAHMYNVTSLEEAIKKIFMTKPSNWYDVTVALKVFALVRNIDGCDELKTKLVEVLKSMHKDLQACEEFGKLFTKDANAAKDLCAMSFSV